MKDIFQALRYMKVLGMGISFLFLACGNGKGRQAIPVTEGFKKGAPPRAEFSSGPGYWEARGTFEVAGIFVSADGSKVFTSMGTRFVALNSSDGSVIWEYIIPDDHEIDEFEASKAGNTVVIAHRWWQVAKGGGDGSCEIADPQRDAARILDGDTGQILASIPRGYENPCNGYMWNGTLSRDGQLILLERSQQWFTKVDLHARDGSLIWASPPGGMTTVDFDVSSITQLVLKSRGIYRTDGTLVFQYIPATEDSGTYFGKFSPDGQYLLVSYYRPQMNNIFIDLWSTNGTQVWSHPGTVSHVAALSNGARHIAIMEPDGIGIYNSQGEKLFSHSLGFSPWLGQMEMTPDGRYLAVAVQPGRAFIENPDNPGVGDALGWASVEAQFLVLDLDADPANRVRWQGSFGDVNIPYISISDDGSVVAVGGWAGFIRVLSLIPP